MGQVWTPGDTWPSSLKGIDDTHSARAALDASGLVTWWNPGAEKLLGYSSEEMVGASARCLFDEQAYADISRSIRAVARWNGTVHLKHQDGHAVEIRLLAHRRLAEGRTVGWLLVSALPSTVPPPDNTIALWGFEQSPRCAMWLYDLDLRLLRANRAAERMMNLPQSDMRGLRAAEFNPHPEVEKMEQVMLQCLQTGEISSWEAFVQVPGDLRKRTWSVLVSPLHDNDGVVCGMLGTVDDVTKEHWARKRLQLLNDATSRIGSTLELGRTAQELADVAVPNLADFAAIDLLLESEPSRSLAHQGSRHVIPNTEATWVRRIAQQSVLSDVPETKIRPGEAHLSPSDTLVVKCLAGNRSVVLTDVRWRSADQAANPSNEEILHPVGIHGVMAVPLRARGLTLGVATFMRHLQQDPFSPDDLILAEEITARAALCIDNARRYSHEQETAAALQRSLLPRHLPTQAAVELASRYIATGTLSGVGGDWFDVIPLSSARVALVVGDVVGHGVQAAATMGRLRGAVRTLADVDLPPDELLTHLDDLVLHLTADADSCSSPDQAAEIASGFGATCLYAVYDPVSQLCTIARAGHPVPALVTSDGIVNLIDVPAGPPLGLGGLPFESIELPLPEGSLLALYTDGLIESREHDIDHGIARLRQSLAQPATSLDDLCDSILHALLPRRSTDDVALLIARTRALSPLHVATWDVPSDPTFVAQARRLTTAQLKTWSLEDAAYVAELVVSELVTNAMRYGAPPIRLRLIRGDRLTIEVADGSNAAPHLRRARTYDEGGRGLLLVAQTAYAWGSRHSSAGKTIWAEVAVDLS
ncbi:SpoIIE family protein phosphatase [Streptomyces sp. enrichment culture]|uniref:SpoIIE family protein phosphatase n=1 Tax=Streptomyces sp. enrichment culture TaxID=1795815 RepID=UPI003F578945